MNKYEKRIHNIFIFTLFSLISVICLNCKKEQVNWTKVDPKFKMELDGKNYTENSIISGILQTEGQISDLQKEKLSQKEIQVITIAGNIATVQFPLRSLPFITNQSFILLISKPVTQKPVSKP